MSNFWEPLLHYSDILEKYKVGFRKNYDQTLKLRNKVQCEIIRNLNNKHSAKIFFTKYNIKVPKLIYYTETEEELDTFIPDKYVAKPAHLSENKFVFINNKDKAFVSLKLNKALKQEAGAREPLMLRKAQRGILIEEYIDYDYELKVFVLYGKPIIADLRKGPKEWSRVTFIDEKNTYVDLKDIYQKICNIAKDLKIDFFRIDFFIKGKDIYGSEFAFRPSTILPLDIKSYIYNQWLEYSKK